ncbi:MAG: VOC family protein [SAR202 cluster bacterium]|nr:VOC family protein [SAR202 cluster bacterium]
MAFRINHIHLKAADPRKSADWWVKAFNLKVESDAVRPFGDRFIRCKSEDGGMTVNISGPRNSDKNMPRGNSGVHFGLEHFGFDTTNMEADIKRLEGLGAKLLEGPIVNPAGGPRIAFIACPDDVRVELIEVKA